LSGFTINEKADLNDPFVKHFDDRYTQSREYQFLDLLNQLQVPVPAVLSNETHAGMIRMEHVGVNLQEWIDAKPASAAAQSQALATLHQALCICRDVAKKDVWHFDLATRNFMVEQTTATSTVTVRLIDFSLAVSKRFPLEKPLWVRPDRAQQHPALYAALVSDWLDFFTRNTLEEPTSYDQEFDIPITIYRGYWASDLSADRIQLLWCVIAHGLGNMLIRLSSSACFDEAIRAPMESTGRSLLNLDSELLAQNALEKAILWLAYQINEPTPRPVFQPDPHAITPRANAVAANARTAALADQPSAPGASPVGPTHKLSPIRIFLSTLVGFFAYVVVDAAYVAYKIQISHATWLITVGIVLASSVLLLRMPVVAWRYKAIQRLSQAHGLAFIGFATEFWNPHVPTLWAVGFACLGLVYLVANYEIKIVARR
jgi:hypothetical protein